MYFWGGIKMKLKSILNRVFDKYYMSTEDRYDKLVEIFKNPSRKEFQEVITDYGNSMLLKDKNKIFRFLFDREDLYIWSPEVAYLHQDFANDLGMGNLSHEAGVLAGKGKYENGKIVLKGIRYYREKDVELLRAGEFDWLEEYGFDIDEILNSI